MKKRILSILLTVCLLLSVVPTMGVTASAESAGQVCYVDFNDDGSFTDGTDTKYASITEALAAAKPDDETAEKPTVIRMIADSSENITIPSGRFITLDLNGYVLKSAADGTPVIIVGSGTATDAELTINDSNPTATHSGDYEDLPAGGIITGGNNDTNVNNGGGICNYGTLTMNGGTVTKNITTNSDSTGGGVYNHGTFTMNAGAVITGNSSSGNGGGVSNKGVDNARFIMNGGKITGNTSFPTDGYGAGGGVYNEGTFEMYGGEITGNSCGTTEGGGVDYVSGTMTVGGTAVIKDNTSKYGGGKTNNLYIDTGKYVTVAGGDKAPVENKMEICVTLAGGTGAVTTACSADYTEYFTSDNADYTVYNNGKDSSNYVYIGNIAAEIVETGWRYDTLSEAFEAVANNQTIRMLKDVCEGGYYSEKSCTLDLNGYILSPKDNRKDVNVIVVTYGSSLTITDGRPTAKHEGSYASLPDGGVITGCESAAINNSGSLTIAGGTITGNSQGVYNAGGTLTIVGGTITGNSLGIDNNCYCWCDDESKVPPELYITDGFLNIGGTARITGNTDADGNASNVYLRNASWMVGEKEYTIESTITIGTKTAASEGNGVAAPAAGMNIGVTTQTSPAESSPVQFTSNGASADTSYFFSDDEDYVVRYDDSNKYLILKTNPNITATKTIEGDTNNGVTVSEDTDTAIGTFVEKDKANQDYDTLYKFAVKEQTPADGTKKTAIENIAGSNRTVTFYDATFTKTETINDVAQTPVEIADTGDTVLSFTIAYDMTGKCNLAVFRYHGEEATELTQVFSKDNPQDGTFYVEGSGADTKVTVFASKFSAYALGSSELPEIMKNAAFYVSLTLNDNIDINFKIKELGTGFEQSKLTVTVDGAAVGSDKYTVSGTTLSCVLKSVEPQSMGDSIRVVVTYDGVQVKSFEYSIRRYCESVLNSGDYGKESELGQLCQAVLNYGKYAEDYYTGAAASTVNKDYEIDFSQTSIDSNKVLKEENTFKDGSNVSAASHSLTLDSAFTLNFKLKYNGELTLTNKNITIKNNLDQTVDAADISVEQLTEEDYNYKISIHLGASRLSRSYTLTINNVSESKFKLTYGVYNYCSNIQSMTGEAYTDTLKTLCKAIYNYGEMAKAYTDSLSSK